MCTWTVAAALRTSVHVEGSVTPSLVPALAVHDGVGRDGPGGVCLTMHMEAGTSATSHVAALSALATDVLPWVAGAELVDLWVSAHAQRSLDLRALLPGQPTTTSRHHPAPTPGLPLCPRERGRGASGPRAEKPEAPDP